MFEVCCRLCLQQVPLQNIHSLYGKHKEFLIRDKIFELFEIEFSDTEKLSAVCNDCLEKIETVDAIRTFFLDADQKFKNILAGTTGTSSIKSHDEETNAKLVENENEEQSNEQSEALIQDNEDYLSNSNKIAKTIKAEIESPNHDLDDVEILQIEQESDNDSVILNVCQNENLSDLEVSLLAMNKIPGTPHESLENDDDEEYIMSQSGVMYASDQSCDLTTIDDPASMSDIITDEEASNMRDFTEQPESVSGEQVYDIVTLEYQCNVCNDIFETAVSLIEHINSFHINEYPHQCKHCHLVYKTKEELHVHDCSVKPKIFNCSNCSDSHRTLKDLRNHTRNCHGSTQALSKAPKKDNLFKCDYCTLTLNNNQHLIDHVQTLHPNDYVLHPCDQCDRTFGNTQSLRAHLAAHDRNYKCSFCGKLCPTAVSLAGHENTHTKEQPFQCAQCGRSFAQYTSMRRHMKIHFNEKAYQCDMCPKRFRQKTVMQTHRRIHTGEKPFVCDTCSKTFRDHSTLAKHRKIHEKKITKVERK
ncbi:zinc finger protein ZFP2-like [Armigeres subalbatus]|uniref:zinc finger protein ZFP2-like n=1 Tax=Armigeres subalbatus TaxID=124917 RepID=UPI002ED3105D